MLATVLARRPYRNEQWMAMDRQGEKTEINTRLEVLRAAHRALDLRIKQMAEEPSVDLVELQRLKKQKLALKDRLTYLESKSHPDIIA